MNRAVVATLSLVVAHTVAHTAIGTAQRPPGHCPPATVIELLPAPEARPAPPADGTAHLACAVDRAAVVHPRRFPEYPSLFAGSHVNGHVRVGFTISAAGTIDNGSGTPFSSTPAAARRRE
ncbi:MAG: hypothetical protein ACHQWU_08960 [Gemmatimonadales bacterium]